MRKTHLVGLLLWRGGWLLIAGTALFEAARWALQFLELPAQLEIGIGFLAVGLLLVFVSLILERLQDARAEQGLQE